MARVLSTVFLVALLAATAAAFALTAGAKLELSPIYQTAVVLLHGRHGIARRVTLHLRAPQTPGVYRLYGTAATHSAQGLVVVG